jgi:hypothetical protein
VLCMVFCCGGSWSKSFSCNFNCGQDSQLSFL